MIDAVVFDLDGSEVIGHCLLKLRCSHGKKSTSSPEQVKKQYTLLWNERMTLSYKRFGKNNYPSYVKRKVKVEKS